MDYPPYDDAPAFEAMTLAEKREVVWTMGKDELAALLIMCSSENDRLRSRCAILSSRLTYIEQLAGREK